MDGLGMGASHDCSLDMAFASVLGDRAGADTVGLARLERTRIMLASQVIREQGWCQGQMKDPYDRVCAAGAIVMARMGGWRNLDNANGWARWRDALVLRDVIGSVHVTRWNDEDTRTEDEVVAALEEMERRTGQVKAVGYAPRMDVAGPVKPGPDNPRPVPTTLPAPVKEPVAA